MTIVETIDVLQSDGSTDTGLVRDSSIGNWARESTKPSYTASEVGALPAETSHLSGDVPITTKINNKTLNADITLTAEDVGAISDTTIIPYADGVTITQAEDGKLVAIGGGSANVQSDWTETDTTSDAYIKNKPTIKEVSFEQTISEGTEIGKITIGEDEFILYEDTEVNSGNTIPTTLKENTLFILKEEGTKTAYSADEFINKEFYVGYELLNSEGAVSSTYKRTGKLTGNIYGSSDPVSGNLGYMAFCQKKTTNVGLLLLYRGLLVSDTYNGTNIESSISSNLFYIGEHNGYYYYYDGAFWSSTGNNGEINIIHNEYVSVFEDSSLDLDSTAYTIDNLVESGICALAEANFGSSEDKYKIYIGDSENQPVLCPIDIGELSVNDITDFPTIPTKVSELENDSSFVKKTDIMTTFQGNEKIDSSKLSISTNLSNAITTTNGLYVDKVSISNTLTSGTKIGTISIGNTDKDLYTPTVTVTQNLTEGTQIGSIKINDTTTNLYAPEVFKQITSDSTIIKNSDLIKDNINISKETIFNSKTFAGAKNFTIFNAITYNYSKNGVNTKGGGGVYNFIRSSNNYNYGFIGIKGIINNRLILGIVMVTDSAVIGNDIIEACYASGDVYRTNYIYLTDVSNFELNGIYYYNLAFLNNYASLKAPVTYNNDASDIIDSLVMDSEGTQLNIIDFGTLEDESIELDNIIEKSFTQMKSEDATLFNILKYGVSSDFFTGTTTIKNIFYGNDSNKADYLIKQPDWNETNTEALNYIKNKPTIPPTTTVVQNLTEGIKIGSVNNIDLYAPAGSGGIASYIIASTVEIQEDDDLDSGVLYLIYSE